MTIIFSLTWIFLTLLSRGEQRLQTDPNVNIHCLSNVLHYGQSVFEGLKVFQTKKGSIHAFNSPANAIRFQKSQVC